MANFQLSIMTDVLAPTRTRSAVVAGGVVAFLALWGGLMPSQRHSVDPLRNTTARFPTLLDLP